MSLKFLIRLSIFLVVSATLAQGEENTVAEKQLVDIHFFIY